VRVDRQIRASEIYKAVLECPPDARDGYISEACGDDPILRAILQEMLSSGIEGGAFETEPMPATTPLGLTDNLAGRRFGHYELLRRVGRGGMGSVYAARRIDQEFRKIVAVKLVKPGMETEEILLRFKHERQVLAGLDHSNIARLLDGGTEAGIPYLVMEYVEGTPIDQYCRTRRLSVSERLDLFCTVCSAVQYAHQSLVVHRDIKPSNIMVSTDGVPKLLDFGIAKVLNPEFDTGGLMTRAIDRPMTPDYASPEQVRGEPVTTSSDVYALGVLLYWLLTTQHPLRLFYEKFGFQKAVAEVEPERPSQAVMHLPDGIVGLPEGSPEKLRNRLRGDLDCILLMALRKEPNRRYESVQHFADDIRRHREGLPVRAHRDSLRYRSGKFFRRHTAGVIAASIVIIALIASSIVSMAFYRQAIHESRRAEARFSDVRQLASFVLFDFDRIIAGGVTPARKAVIEKATEYLDRLEKDRGGDPALEKELVRGYLKVGDLQGNLYNGANLGDRAAARASYERALTILEASRNADPALLASIRVRLADLLAQSGSLREAVVPYRKAIGVLGNGTPSDRQSRIALLDVLRKLAFAQTQLGDYPGALSTYEEFLNHAKSFLRREPESFEWLRSVALGELRAGETRARMGDVERGLPEMQRALGLSQQLAAANPQSPGAQRPVATASGLIGDILVLSGRYREAADSFRTALQMSEKLATADPGNGQYQRDLSTYLARLADADARSGEMNEARILTRKALAVLRPMVDRGDASEVDLFQYAWILLTTRCAELRNARSARAYAERLVEITTGQDSRTLDLLARAYAAAGQRAQAVETEGRALDLLPADSPSDLRSELEGNLADFRSGLAAPSRK
jgi:serine/threonine protein kinase/tetratricopeptide (TPR) repeat protein